MCLKLEQNKNINAKYLKNPYKTSKIILYLLVNPDIIIVYEQKTINNNQQLSIIYLDNHYKS